MTTVERYFRGCCFFWSYRMAKDYYDSIPIGGDLKGLTVTRKCLYARDRWWRRNRVEVELLAQAEATQVTCQTIAL